MSRANDTPPNNPTDNAGGKRPYVKPAFRHEKVFEVMALACGKVTSVAGPCHSNRKVS
ncbi:MAG TPA: hypothetical protein VGH80_07850 [Xanthomonadaceae bacterium]|jgi:hypothetical protein